MVTLQISPCRGLSCVSEKATPRQLANRDNPTWVLTEVERTRSAELTQDCSIDPPTYPAYLEREKAV